MTGFLFGGGGSGGDVGTTTFLSTGSTTARNNATRWSEVTNVKDFGATGDGSTDDTADIQAAIDAAATLGVISGIARKGGLVFFPPGNYKITAALVNHTASTYVQLVGSGITATTLQGAVSGFIIDQADAYPSGITAIRRMSVYNSQTSSGHDATIGAIRFQNAPCGKVEECYISGWTGIDATGDAFNTTVMNCQFTGCFVAGYFGQVGLYNSSAVGNTYGFLVYNSGFTAKGIRTESCLVGLSIGRDNTGAVNQANGVTISGYSTERCDTAIEVFSTGGCHISGTTLTATVGTAKATTAASWSGGTATILSTTTLSSWGWSAGTKSIKIEGVAGFATGGFVTATRTGTSTFTYTVADPSPNVWTPDLTWSFKPQYGLRVANATGLVVAGLTSTVHNCEQAEIDLFYGGSTAGTRNALVGVSTIGGASGTGWLLPTTISKASFSYINCDNPTSALTFADLPGQSGVYTSPAIEGTTYYITDGNQATAGMNVTAGGGSNKSWVTYDGTNWIRGAA